MPDQINQKDADQDQLIAVLTHRIEDAEKMTEELRDRVRNLEKKVWGASAVIAALITIVGIADALEAKEIDYGRYGSTKSEELLQFPRS